MIDAKPEADLGATGVFSRPSHAETSIQSPELKALCEGCGKYHGSIGAELACLRAVVGALRELTGRFVVR